MQSRPRREDIPDDGAGQKPAPVNGRVTQRDLYDAIGGLRGEMQDGFTGVRRELRDLTDSVHGVESYQMRECAEDDARDLVAREKRDKRTAQGISRRWFVGLLIVAATPLLLALAGVVKP